jgi:hypothetical protein
MKRLVVGPAEPPDVESLGVVVVVSLGLDGPTLLAGLLSYEAAAQGGGEGLVGPDFELVAFTPGSLPAVLDEARGGLVVARAVGHWRASP